MDNGATLLVNQPEPLPFYIMRLSVAIRWDILANDGLSIVKLLIT